MMCQWAREMVCRHGSQTIAYQVLLPSITLRAYPHLPALVGYVERWRVRVVVGLPIAEPEKRAEAMERFEQEAAKAGCTVCYFGVEEADEALYAFPNAARMRLGAQPVWNPPHWQETLLRRPSLRAQIRRARNKGVGVQEWPLACVEKSAAIRVCLNDWLNKHVLPPMHFLAEPDILEHLVDRRVFVAECKGKPVAFLVATPIPRKRGWLVEQLVRGSAAPNGTSELLFHSLMQVVPDCEYVTFGLTPLTQQGRLQQNEALWLRMLTRWARAHGRRFYNFSGIEAFRARLVPQRWENVYAVVNTSRFTPRALGAVAAAFTQEPLGWYLLRALARAAQWECNRLQRFCFRVLP